MNEFLANEMTLENEEVIQAEFQPADNEDSINQIAELKPDTQVDPEFKPKKIGVPDILKSGSIVRVYEKFIKQIPTLKEELERILATKDPFSIEVFIKYLQAADHKLWILERYVTAENISFGKMDPIQMIELKLVPSPDTSTAIELTNKIMATIDEIQNTGFNYPIKELWNTELSDWDLTSDFFDEVEDFLTRKTQTTRQNLILNKFEHLCVILNDLAELGVLRPANGKLELDSLDEYVEINKFYKSSLLKKELGERALEAFTVNPYIFHKHRLQSFRVKGPDGIQRSKFSNKEMLFNL
jgi:hypothetical protein